MAELNEPIAMPSGEDIPDRLLPEPGTYNLRIVKTVADDGASFDWLARRINAQVTFSILDRDYNGELLNKTFVIGVESDPGAKLPDTWKKNRDVVALKQLMAACGESLGGELTANLRKLQNKHVMARVTNSKPNDDGRQFANVVAFYALGSREAGIDAPKGGHPASAPMPAAASKPMTPPSGAPVTRPSNSGQAPGGAQEYE